MIDLNTCVKGQKLRLRNGRLAKYCASRGHHHTYPHLIAHCDDGCTYSYTDNGTYSYGSNCKDFIDVIEILPLETTKPASHPSIAWWESCPWIADRAPTEEDGDSYGQVIMQSPGEEGTKTICFMYWKYVKLGQTWIHCMNWNPPTQTPKEQAIELINNHEDGWRPTPKQWHIIRKGLEAS
jgi:hypothetical protein